MIFLKEIYQLKNIKDLNNDYDKICINNLFKDLPHLKNINDNDSLNNTSEYDSYFISPQISPTNSIDSDKTIK
jgi:hypothetical protein